MTIFIRFNIFICLVLCINSANAFVLQTDTVPVIDTTKKTIQQNPKLAAKRSAMVPGWGQVYNKQIWKVPIIYAGLGITTYIFFDNLKTYNDVRFAYNAKVKASKFRDSIDYFKIKEYLAPIDVNGLSIYRKKFRQQVDYSVLFFVAFWGLNVADAVVFAHLKNFDVSDDLSGTLKFGNSNIANNNGIQLQLHLKNKKEQKLFVIK